VKSEAVAGDMGSAAAVSYDVPFAPDIQITSQITNP